MAVITTSIVIYTFLGLLGAYLARWWVQNERKYASIPGPPGMPFLGNALEVMKDSSAACDKWAKQYGAIFKYKFFFWYIVVVVDAEVMKHVLVTHEDHYSKNVVLYTMLADLLGDTLLTIVDVHTHHSLRATIAEAFSYTNIKLYYPVFIEKALVLAHRWDASASSGEQVDVLEDIDHLGVDIIGRIAFASEFQALEQKDNNPNRAKSQGERLHELLLDAFMDIGSDVKMFIPIMRQFSLSYKKQLRATKEITEEMKIILAQKREVKKTGAKGVVRDVLDILLTLKDENGNLLSDESIIDQCKLFLLAGQETSATGMTWILYLLASHPDIQETLYKEIISTFKKDGDDDDNDDALLKMMSTGPSAVAIDGMKYLSQVIKEALRYRPPAVTVMRKCEHDDKVLGDCVIPAGAIVYTSPWVVHHYAGNWTRPEEFDPSRWATIGTHEEASSSSSSSSASLSYTSNTTTSSTSSSSSSSYVQPGAFIPFMMGSRNCIGNRFAMLEMKAVIAVLVRRFQFVLPDDHPVVTGVPKPTLKPVPRVKLQIRRRRRDTK